MIIRTPKNRDNPYAQINKFALRDPSLSLKAKGLLAFLLSLPDNWQIRPREIQRHHTNGEKSVYSGLKELINAKYLKRIQHKDAKNQFSEYEYIVFEYPDNDDSRPLVPSVISSVPLLGIPKTGTRLILQGKSPTVEQLETLADLAAQKRKEEADIQNDLD